MLLAAVHAGADLTEVNLTQTSFHTRVRSTQSEANFSPSCCERVDFIFFFFSPTARLFELATVTGPSHRDGEGGNI